MNFGRVVAAAVAATVCGRRLRIPASTGLLLATEFAEYPGVYRSNEAGMAYPAADVRRDLRRDARRRRSSMRRATRAGAASRKACASGSCSAVFIVGVFVGVNYATLNIGRQHRGDARGRRVRRVARGRHRDRAGLQACRRVGALARRGMIEDHDHGREAQSGA